MWLGLAEFTRKEGETLMFQSEKRLAIHVTLGAIFTQFLTFIGWLNPPLSVIFIVPAAVGAVVAAVQFYLRNDPSWLRWVNLASGLLYVFAHFFGEGCRMIERSGARYFTAILPSLLFHTWMGGDTRVQSAVCGVHLLLFVIFAIVEGSTASACYDTIYDPLTTNPQALVFVFTILPLGVTLFGILLVISAYKIRSAGWGFTERMAADLARYIREHNFAGARSYIAAATSGRDAQMSLCDLVMCAGVTHAAMFEEISLIPANASNAFASFPFHHLYSQQQQYGSSDSIGALAQLYHLNPQQQQQLQFFVAQQQQHRLSSVGGAGAGALGGGGGGGGGLGSSGALGGLGGAPADNVSQRSGSLATGGIGGQSANVNNYLSPTKLDAVGGNIRDQHGKMRRRSSAILTRQMSNKFSDVGGYGGGGSSAGGGGGGGSMMQQQPLSITPGFVLLITLPNFPMYAHRQQSTEMLKLLLGEYFDAVSQICDAFDGTIMFCAFTDVFCVFDQAAAACGAALAIRALLEKEAVHHRDLPFLELQPTKTLSIVFHTTIVSTIVGSRTAAKIGVCDGQLLFEVVKAKALRTAASLPLLLIASKLLPLVAKVFETGRSSVPKFSKINNAREINELGYPVLPAEAASPLKQHELDPPLVSEVVADEIAAVATAAAIAAAGAGNAGNGDKKARAVADSASGGGPPPPQSDSHTAAGSGAGDAASASGDAGSGVNELFGSGDRVRTRLSPEVAEVWRQYDADRNGTLEMHEMKELLLDIGIEMADDELQKFFEDIDTDHSGTISQEEFAKAFERPQLAGLQMIAEVRRKAQQMRTQNGLDNLPLVLAAWKRYDSDGNGSLDASEIEKVLRDLGIVFPSSQHVEWFVEKFDQNGSGTIELDEFASLFSETSGNTQLNAAKARIETVTRVLSNKEGNMTYSTPAQDEHDTNIRFHEFWEAYSALPLFLYAIYNFGTIGYQLALYEDATVAKIIVDWLFDILYYSWFALKLLYLLRKRRGQYILERSEIRADYVSSLEFWMDLITVFPLDIIYIALRFGAGLQTVHAWFRLNKLFALYHATGQMGTIFRKLAPSNQSIVISLIWYFLISHVFAAFFITTARLYGDEYAEELTGWDQTVGDINTSYLQGILWALLTLAGQVKGAPVPTLDIHVTLLFVSVFVGIPLFGILLGVISNAVTTENGEVRFRRTIDALRGYFEYTELPAHLELACIDYYRHIFVTTGSLEVGANPLADLPVELSIDVTIAIGSEMLRKVPIFADASANVEFVHELTSKMTTRVIEPGLRIVKKGERGSNMYFITYGEFHIVNDADGSHVWTLRKGNFFGEIALLQNVKRTATIYNDKNRFANVLVLEKRDFDQVAAIFPESVTKIFQKAESRLKELREKEAQEAKEAKEKRDRELKERDLLSPKKKKASAKKEGEAAVPEAAVVPASASVPSATKQNDE